MSFSAQQKSYVISQSYKSSCCRKALLMGAMLAKGSLDQDNIKISVEKVELAEFLSHLVAEFYGSKPSLSTAANGGRRIMVEFNSRSAAKYIAEIDVNSLYVRKCDACLSSFLRGAFLACGRISDPRSQYSLEFSMGERCELFSNFMKSLGLNPGISDKPSERVVYLKNSTDIEDFCGLAGLNKALFTLMDAKFEGEIRKNAMRVANCETNNITRAVNAAKPQLLIISALEKADLLSLLPDELESTARLRLEYPDLSLSQLAAIAVPAISKPGLSHRLKKIVEMGEQILKKHEGRKED